MIRIRFRVVAMTGLLMLAAAPALAIPARTPLRTVPIEGGKMVDRVETMRVDFKPGEAMPKHVHNVPAICFVAKGSLSVKAGDEPVRTVGVGDVTLEPPAVVTHEVRNVSASEDATLLCVSLAADADKELSTALDTAPGK